MYKVSERWMGFFGCDDDYSFEKKETDCVLIVYIHIFSSTQCVSSWIIHHTAFIFNIMKLSTKCTTVSQQGKRWKIRKKKYSWHKKFENEINISHHKLNNNYSQKCVLNANHFVGNNGILNRLNENCSTLTRRCRLCCVFYVIFIFHAYNAHPDMLVH